MSAALDYRARDPGTIGATAAAQAPGAEAAGLLRFITCGSVDDGKSTLIGRLLYDAGAVPEDQIEAAARDSRRFGTQGGALDLALLVDGLSAEREQGITIDVAYRYFSTARRAFIVADTPGHEQYTRNMATGASTADLAVILIDARKGVLPQTRRHAFIVSLVGVRHVVVAVNKMDLVGYDESVFTRIRDDFAAATASLGFRDVAFIPVSALTGENVARPSAATPWYRGRPLLETLETAAPQAADPAVDSAGADFVLPVQWVNRPGPDFRGFAGTVAAGRISRGDPVTILPAGTRSRVARILDPSGDVASAAAGEAVTLTLADEVDASRGDVIAASAAAAQVVRGFAGRVLWMSDTAAAGRALLVQQGHVTANASLAVISRIDIHSFAEHPASDLDANAIARVQVRVDRPLVVTPYAAGRTLGAFIMVDRISNETVALGVIDAVADDAAAPVSAAPAARRRRSLARPLLLGSEEGSPSLAEAVSWRVASALAVGLVALAASGSTPVGLAAALADLALRTPLRALHRALFPRRRVPADAVGDGGGI